MTLWSEIFSIFYHHMCGPYHLLVLPASNYNSKTALVYNLCAIVNSKLFTPRDNSVVKVATIGQFYGAKSFHMLLYTLTVKVYLEVE